MAPKPRPWEGPELAMQAVIARLENIRLNLQPPRPELIYDSATQALDLMAQLQQWFLSQPPGSYYYQSVHKQLPPTGGYPPQVPQQLHLEKQFERQERREEWTEER